MTARPDPDCRRCGGTGTAGTGGSPGPGQRSWHACGCSAPVCLGCGATVPRGEAECGRCDGYDDRPATPMERAWLAWIAVEVCS